MNPESKIPTTIVTGFLGAGKTTLIRNLIEGAGGRRIALIVNEFGDVGVDGDLLKACGLEGCGEEDIVELANGCICCTVAEDFVPTMQKLLAREMPPEHIVIETSGLALPQPLVRAFRWPEIRTRVTVDGVVAVIDGAAVAEGRFAEDEAAVDAARATDPNLDHESPLHELFEDQLGCADLVVVNKMDLLDAAGMEAVDKALSGHARPAAGIVRTAHGRLPTEILLGLGAGTEDDMEGRESHHDGDDHDHDHDDFESFVVAVPAAEDPEILKTRLADILARHDVLRAKGFLAVEGRDMRLVVQAVGPRVDAYFDRAWTAGEAREGRLVVIGMAGLDRHGIETALAG